MRSGKLAELQERIERGKVMTSARLSTEALESCLRRVICKRLVERLNAGLHRKLTLISAPAGFGKTALRLNLSAGSR